MAKNKKILVVSACSFLFLTGSSAFETFIAENQDNIRKISPGLTLSEVIAIMGTKVAQVKNTHVSNPYKDDIFTKEKDEYEILYYLTHKPTYSAIRESQTTPVVIKNGKVIGIGVETLKRVKGGK